MSKIPPLDLSHRLDRVSASRPAHTVQTADLHLLRTEFADAGREAARNRHIKLPPDVEIILREGIGDPDSLGVDLAGAFLSGYSESLARRYLKETGVRLMRPETVVGDIGTVHTLLKYPVKRGAPTPEEWIAQSAPEHDVKSLVDGLELLAWIELNKKEVKKLQEQVVRELQTGTPFPMAQNVVYSAYRQDVLQKRIRENLQLPLALDTDTAREVVATAKRNEFTVVLPTRKTVTDDKALHAWYMSGARRREDDILPETWEADFSELLTSVKLNNVSQKERAEFYRALVRLSKRNMVYAEKRGNELYVKRTPLFQVEGWFPATDDDSDVRFLQELTDDDAETISRLPRRLRFTPCAEARDLRQYTLMPGDVFHRFATAKDLLGIRELNRLPYQLLVDLRSRKRGDVPIVDLDKEKFLVNAYGAKDFAERVRRKGRTAVYKEYEKAVQLIEGAGYAERTDRDYLTKKNGTPRDRFRLLPFGGDALPVLPTPLLPEEQEDTPSQPPRRRGRPRKHPVRS